MRVEEIVAFLKVLATWTFIWLERSSRGRPWYEYLGYHGPFYVVVVLFMQNDSWKVITFGRTVE